MIRIYIFISFIIINLLMSGCAITPYETESLKNIHWIIKTNNTQTGKIVQSYLSDVTSLDKAQTYQVKLSGEKIRQRTIAVDEKGQPSSYLQEALIILKISSQGKEFINEPVITAREFSQKESSSEVDAKKEEIINTLANDILLRLNDIANQDKEVLLHKYSIYQELHRLPPADKE